MGESNSRTRPTIDIRPALKTPLRLLPAGLGFGSAVKLCGNFTATPPIVAGTGKAESDQGEVERF